MTDHDPTRREGVLDRLIEALTRQAEISAQALPLLERIAIALERSATAPVSTAPLGPSRGLAEHRLALQERRWDDADSIARDLLAGHPDDPAVLGLADESDRAKQGHALDLRERIEAARQANDADGVLALRDDLVPISPAGSLKDLDAVLVKWLMGLIHRRLRGGTIRPDLVELAGRVADRFGATAEGASLKASLPTLRRSSGLCPRCGEPYAGLADACPKCLGAAFEEPPPIELPPATLPDDEEPEPEASSGPIDLNNTQLWQDP